MAAPYRIHRKSSVQNSFTNETATSSDDYLTRLVKLIPTPAIALYVFGSNIIPASESVALMAWSFFCLSVVIVLTLLATQAPGQHQGPDWFHMAISAVSFVLWLYALGGPFSVYHLTLPWLASLLAAAWTTFVPLLYKGTLLLQPSALS